MKRLAKARAAKLRAAFGMDYDSPLRTRRLRDALEHFDERLDAYLLALDAGMVFPDPMVGRVEMVNESLGHLFKMVDPSASQFVLLGEPHSFGDVREEVERILDLAMTMDRAGCRLRPPGVE